MTILKSKTGFIKNKFQVLIGTAGLLVGTLVYLIDRPPDQTYFVINSPIDISLYNMLPNIFGHIGNSLPAFMHVFSFILITAGLVAADKKGYISICLFWFFVDSAFELGQKFNIRTSKLVPDWFSQIPLLENTKNYFLLGTFDLMDILAIAIGALIAYLFCYYSNVLPQRHQGNFSIG